MRAALAIASIALLLTGCSAQDRAALSFSSMSTDDHLRCAAQISGYDQLLRDGQLDPLPDGSGDRLVGLMTHLNAYSVPQDIREADAFDALNELRDKVLAAESPEAIRSAASVCIEQAVQALA
uniref:hypothetical protein n=1 Tax=Parerythrobacter lutipelagi TaxID=1964208 RepID=UPI0010F87AD8|nr:hypothetical protein [Parerythrobacter lutipelagi]